MGKQPYGLRLNYAKIFRGTSKNIHIETYERAYEMMAMDLSRWSPTTRETADHSLPYVAVALLKGSIDEEVFAPENLKTKS